MCAERGGRPCIVGDSVREISDRDLVLITGSYLEHAWLNGNFSKNADVHEVCVQFSPDLFESGFIDKKQFYPIKKMFEYAAPRHRILRRDGLPCRARSWRT